MVSSKDINSPTYGLLEFDAEPEEHEEPSDESINSNVFGFDHPIFSSTGALSTINWARGMGNTIEKKLSGEISEETFKKIGEAVKKTKFPYDLLMFAMDWENDITSGGGDAYGIAKKMAQFVPSLRGTLGRDPLNAEVFMAYVYGNVEKVKQIYDLHIQKPEEKAKPAGTKKDDIIYFKLRNGKKTERTNREVYDFFYKRIPTGKVLFKKIMSGTDKYGN